eukprot:INCI9193.1.p1 GENE.INCI9193.1~~INCI9193.1.p1  ORF type:complete len:366 (-),score=42.58 INCI9193.1:532-1629(-)
MKSLGHYEPLHQQLRRAASSPGPGAYSPAPPKAKGGKFSKEPRFFAPEDYKRTGGYPHLSEKHLAETAALQDREEDEAAMKEADRLDHSIKFNADFAESYAPLPGQYVDDDGDSSWEDDEEYSYRGRPRTASVRQGRQRRPGKHGTTHPSTGKRVLQAGKQGQSQRASSARRRDRFRTGNLRRELLSPENSADSEDSDEDHYSRSGRGGNRATARQRRSSEQIGAQNTILFTTAAQRRRRASSGPRVDVVLSPRRVQESRGRGRNQRGAKSPSLAKSPTRRVGSWIDRAKAFDLGFPVNGGDDGYNDRQERRLSGAGRGGRRLNSGHRPPGKGAIAIAERDIAATQRQAAVHINKLEQLVGRLAQ